MTVVGVHIVTPETQRITIFGTVREVGDDGASRSALIETETNGVTRIVCGDPDAMRWFAVRLYTRVAITFESDAGGPVPE